MRLLEKACVIANAASITMLIVCIQFDKLPTSPSVMPIGTQAPRITLLDQDGKAVNVSVPGEPVLFVVFRGVWCAYCRSELARLAREVPRFAQTNVHVYGISGDPPDALLRDKERQQLPFPLLSDPERKLTHVCDFSMHCLLLFDGDGTLRWAGLNESWRRPPRYESVLQAAYRLAP
ncbi:peroxiredoxin family protein [Pendulispora rubella]|uniref:thioredoxin-dependent peroxiredoxin n=2 Tax=Pendulispora rubella TaxID=2741070 RepID=A0ABZ2L4U1_9BACT